MHAFVVVFLFRDGVRESHVVSKTFEVEDVRPDFVNPEEDGMGFMTDIPGDYVSIK